MQPVQRNARPDHVQVALWQGQHRSRVGCVGQRGRMPVRPASQHLLEAIELHRVNSGSLSATEKWVKIPSNTRLGSSVAPAQKQHLAGSRPSRLHAGIHFDVGRNPAPRSAAARLSARATSRLRRLRQAVHTSSELPGRV